ncbi:MAG: response regulator transcription factor [Polyangiaceae bacterium]|nr:response regulator transcription factor [Polyangiaceae bacterium]
MSRVLVVDDDPHLRDVVTYALGREGYAVEAAADGKRALEVFEQRGPFSLVVLDVTMPELDGLEVCRRLRARAEVSIVFLSSRDEELDKIVGLEVGGDDYVTKPFSPRELCARVRAVLRRAAAPKVESTDAVTLGALSVDRARYLARVGDAPLPLTTSELELLAELVAAPGRALTREHLALSALGSEGEAGPRAVDTHIKRLRRKLRDAGVDPIETVYGVGYRARAR